MRRSLLLAAAALIAAPALAQVPPAELGQRFVPAPWWMREPVVVAVGEVRTELPANRAQFGARFSAVERSAAAAQTTAAGKVRELDAALRGLGIERVRVNTTFSTRPLYEQYREKDGTLRDNERADKIERYESTANVRVTVRDIAVLERAYRIVVAAKPTGIDQVYFSLEPDNATKTWLYSAALKDAARRARLSVEASGGRLGAPKVIDPSGGVCQTPVLAGWPSYVGGTQPTTVQVPGDVQARFAASPAMMREMSAPAPAPPPPPAPSLEQQAEQVQVTLTPPLNTLQASSCVIYALLP